MSIVAATAAMGAIIYALVLGTVIGLFGGAGLAVALLEWDPES